MLNDHEARAHLAAIVESSDDAIWSTTPDGIVTSWNRGAERLFGYSAAELVGQTVERLVPGDRVRELAQMRDRIFRGERLERVETERLAQDGRSIAVSLTLSPIIGDDGRIAGISFIGRDITERLRMEKWLRESEERYRTLVEMAPDAVVVHQEGRFVYANCAALGVFGARSLEQLQQVNLIDLIHPEEREEVRRRIQQLLDGEEIPLREYRLLRVDQREVSIEVASSLIDYQGRPSIQTIARDITERKRAEEEREAMLKELAFERTRFETVVRQLPLGVLIAEAPTGKVTFDNGACQDIFRRKIEPPENMDDYRQYPLARENGAPLTLEECPVVRALKGETVDEQEYRVIRGDGSAGVLSIHAAPITDADGRIVAALTTFNDITERKTAVLALAASQERLNLALEAAELGSCDVQVPSGKGIWSRRHYTILGYPPPADDAVPSDENLVDLWIARIHPDDRVEVLADLEEARQRGTSFRSEHRIVRDDNGEVLWLNVMGRFLCDAIDTTCRFIGVMSDVTERKNSEEALRRSERRFRQMTDSLPLLVWTADPEGRLDYLNAFFESYTGWPRQAPEIRDKLSQPDRLIEMLFHPDDVEQTKDAWRYAITSGMPYQTESRILRADGTYRWHLNRAVPGKDEAGQLVKWYGTGTDIHDLREAQEKLRQEMRARLSAVEELHRQEQLLIRQGRLAAMGEMIGNIAHQWRQPLNTLALIFQELPTFYERNLLDREYLNKSVEKAMQVINYMSKTIDGFRNFFGPDKEKETFRVAEVLSRTVAIVEAAFAQLNLKIEMKLDPEVEICGYPNEFSQVVLNLLMNAKDAVLERKVPRPRVVLSLFREKGRAVITVADNAGGVPLAIMDRIFDPYFTTKGPDKGTGIGLFMSKTIIEKNMNGSLTVRNTEEGAEFRIEV